MFVTCHCIRMSLSSEATPPPPRKVVAITDQAVVIKHLAPELAHLHSYTYAFCIVQRFVCTSLADNRQGIILTSLAAPRQRCRIWYLILRDLLKSVEKIRIFLNSSRNIGQFTWRSKYVLLLPAIKIALVAKWDWEVKIDEEVQGATECL
jgi:hypothetical protein